MTDLEELTSGLQERRAATATFEEVGEGEFLGRAVPYGTITELAPGLYERFSKGTFSRQTKDPARVKVAHRHDEIVGHAVELDERDDGLWVRGRIVDDPDLPEGRKALAMLRHKLIDELSIGFQVLRKGFRTEEHNGGTLVDHHRAALREVSTVPWGQYGRGALVTEVRDDEEAADLAEELARQNRMAEAERWRTLLLALKS